MTTIFDSRTVGAGRTERVGAVTALSSAAGDGALYLVMSEGSTYASGYLMQSDAERLRDLLVELYPVPDAEPAPAPAETTSRRVSVRAESASGSTALRATAANGSVGVRLHMERRGQSVSGYFRPEELRPLAEQLAAALGITTAPAPEPKPEPVVELPTGTKLRLRADAEPMAAKPGAVAELTEDYREGDRFLKLHWLDGLANGQRDGGYELSGFDVVKPGSAYKVGDFVVVTGPYWNGERSGEGSTPARELVGQTVEVAGEVDRDGDLYVKVASNYSRWVGSDYVRHETDEEREARELAAQPDLVVVGQCSPGCRICPETGDIVKPYGSNTYKRTSDGQVFTLRPEHVATPEDAPGYGGTVTPDIKVGDIVVVGRRPKMADGGWVDESFAGIVGKVTDTQLYGLDSSDVRVEKVDGSYPRTNVIGAAHLTVIGHATTV